MERDFLRRHERRGFVPDVEKDFHVVDHRLAGFGHRRAGVINHFAGRRRLGLPLLRARLNVFLRKRPRGKQKTGAENNQEIFKVSHDRASWGEPLMLRRDDPSQRFTRV